MKRLLVNIKLFYYSCIVTIDEFLDKVRGNQVVIDRSDVNSVIERQKQNEKLSRGIAKMTKKLYKNGKFDSKLARKQEDALGLVGGYDKTYSEKIQEARVINKMLRDPTDDTNTTNKMVSHNVQNALKYELELKRRVLCKERTKATANNDSKAVFALTHSITKLNQEIKFIKDK